MTAGSTHNTGCGLHLIRLGIKDGSWRRIGEHNYSSTHF